MRRFFAPVLAVLLLVAAFTPVANAAPAPYSGLSALGMPSSPQRFYPQHGYDVAVEERQNTNLNGNLIDTMPIADHGADCGAPASGAAPVAGVTAHSVTNIADETYVCHDHMMTAINSTGYGAAYITPDAAADWSGGPVTIDWRVSTFRSSQRDWWDAWVTPFSNQEVMPLESWLPDLNGEPKNGIHIRLTGNDTGSAFVGDISVNGTVTDLQSAWYLSQEDYLTPSRSVRTKYELVISRTHIKFWLPEYNLVYIDQNINVPFSQGILQLAHHSYNPTKDASMSQTTEQAKLGLQAAPDTWHWSDITMSSAERFSIDHPDHRWYNSSQATGHFSAVAANTFLRFVDQTGSLMKVSFDGGQTFTQPTPQYHKSGCNAYSTCQYLVPVPVGATSVTFKGTTDGYGEGWFVKEVSLFTAPGSVNPPPPPAAPTISGISPMSGAAGTSLTISGSHFTGATGAMVGSANLSNFVVVNDSTITATVPSGAASGAVMVMSPNGNVTGPVFTVESATPTPTPPPAPTPVDISNAACTVTLNGVQQTGTCSGTFTPAQ